MLLYCAVDLSLLGLKAVEYYSYGRKQNGEGRCSVKEQIKPAWRLRKHKRKLDGKEREGLLLFRISQGPRRVGNWRGGVGGGIIKRY